MKKVLIKKDNVSVTLNPDIMKQLNDETNNKSKFIENLLLKYFIRIGKNTENIIFKL